ncbi:hypothetical protein KI387_003173, partial [Taxus chinensis]
AVRGIVGTKVRVGREKAKKPQTGTRKPELADAGEFSRDSRDKGTRDAKSPNGR